MSGGTHQSETEGLPARIVNYFFDNTANVSVALSKVEGPKLGGCLVVVGVCFELEGEGCSVTGEIGDSVRRTIACDRLCALMTRPIVYL